MQANTYVVLMAGGVGSRFWPLSREEHPKQFLDLLGIGKSLLQITYNRFLKDFSPSQIYIVTSKQYLDEINSQIPSLPISNILLEPQRKNTAPCILYSSLFLEQHFGDSNLIIVPSDHFILEEDQFLQTIHQGIEFISTNPEVLLTLGIKPTMPHTGYGYIQFLESEEPVKKVKTFIEKPQLSFAKDFLASGDFLWNSGIFLWTTEAILQAFEMYLPDTYNAFKNIDYSDINYFQHLNNAYSQTNNISIDYAVLEKSDQVFVLPSSFSWSDLGTWDSIYNFLPKDNEQNVVQSTYQTIKSSAGNMVHISDLKKLVVLQDVYNLIIVDTEDALLIANKDSEQQIKDVVSSLRTKNLDQFL